MKQEQVAARIRQAGIVPIVTVRDVEESLTLVGKLVDAGADLVEIVFRSAGAPQALAEARKRFDRCTFAAGTILDEAGVRKAADAGAHCLVSPGLTPELHQAASAAGQVLIPGVQTASEVMAARQLGYRLLKYYPAEPSNGLVVLGDYANIFDTISFMATGKITSKVLPHYGALRNVAAVGGSWMLAAEALAGFATDRERFLAARS